MNCCLKLILKLLLAASIVWYIRNALFEHCTNGEYANAPLCTSFIATDKLVSDKFELGFAQAHAFVTTKLENSETFQLLLAKWLNSPYKVMLENSYSAAYNYYNTDGKHLLQKGQKVGINLLLLLLEGVRKFNAVAPKLRDCAWGHSKLLFNKGYTFYMSKVESSSGVFPKFHETLLKARDWRPLVRGWLSAAKRSATPLIAKVTGDKVDVNYLIYALQERLTFAFNLALRTAHDGLVYAYKLAKATYAKVLASDEWHKYAHPLVSIVRAEYKKIAEKVNNLEVVASSAYSASITSVAVASATASSLSSVIATAASSQSTSISSIASSLSSTLDSSSIVTEPSIASIESTISSEPSSAETFNTEFSTPTSETVETELSEEPETNEEETSAEETSEEETETREEEPETSEEPSETETSEEPSETETSEEPSETETSEEPSATEEPQTEESVDEDESDAKYEKVRHVVEGALRSLENDAKEHSEAVLLQHRPEIVGILRNITQYGEKSVQKFTQVAERVENGDEDVDAEAEVYEPFAEIGREMANMAFQVRDKVLEVANETLKVLDADRRVTLDSLDDYFDIVLSEASSNLKDSSDWKDLKEYSNLKKKLSQFRSDIELHEFNMSDVNQAMRESQTAAVLLVQEYTQQLTDLRQRCQLVFQKLNEDDEEHEKVAGFDDLIRQKKREAETENSEAEEKEEDLPESEEIPTDTIYKTLYTTSTRTEEEDKPRMVIATHPNVHPNQDTTLADGEVVSHETQSVTSTEEDEPRMVIATHPNVHPKDHTTLADGVVVPDQETAVVDDSVIDLNDDSPEIEIRRGN